MTKISLFIEKNPFQYSLSSDIVQGNISENIDNSSLLPSLPPEGFFVANLLNTSSFIDLRSSAVNILSNLSGINFSYPSNCVFEEPFHYHKKVDNNIHYNICSRLSRLTRSDFLCDEVFDVILDRLQTILQTSLNFFNPILSREHIQLRVNRPFSNDINPPHRDSYVTAWKKSINVWIPIIGCGPLSNLPVVPKSHLYDDRDILRTSVGDAFMNNIKYNVPAITEYCSSPLSLIRPQIGYTNALIFSPYLIHGFALNHSNSTRVAIELRLSY